jgi:putative membrane protein
MKKITYLALIALSTAMMQSCSNAPMDSKETADSMNRANADSIPGDSVTASTQVVAGEEDSKFAVDAAEGGLAEVELGKMAQQRAIDPSVKDFGSMMVNDHSKANEELKTLAKQKGIVLPAVLGEENQRIMNALTEKKGKDFDKAYVDLMVNDHKKDIKLFEDAHEKVTDPDIKAFITKTLPTLKMHLAHVEGLEKTKK